MPGWDTEDMDNPFIPVWDDEQQCFVTAVYPEDWLRDNHPSGLQHDHIENGVSGIMFEWDTGSLFLSLAASYVKLREGDQWCSTAFNQTIDYFVDNDGNLESLGHEVLVCLLETPDEATILYRNGNTLVERKDGIFVSRSLVTPDGVFSWPERFMTEGVEMSDTAIFYLTDRLANKVDGQWEWLVPDEHAAGIKDIIKNNIGVRLL